MQQLLLETSLIDACVRCIHSTCLFPLEDTHTHTHTYIHTCTHRHTYIHTCTHMHTHTYTQVHTDIHTHIYAHRHTYTHMYTYICTHTYTHTYTHTHWTPSGPKFPGQLACNSVTQLLPISRLLTTHSQYLGLFLSSPPVCSSTESTAFLKTVPLPLICPKPPFLWCLCPVSGLS